MHLGIAFQGLDYTMISDFHWCALWLFECHNKNQISKLSGYAVIRAWSFRMLTYDNLNQLTPIYQFNKYEYGNIKYTVVLMS